jgi:DNA repair ATPase RecN
MLRTLRIENLVLIREAELSFAPGLNAVTGETGAGKTIFAQAIGLLLGARADASSVGSDGSEAYVEAELDVPEGFFDEEELGPLADLRPEGEAGLVVARRSGREKLHYLNPVPIRLIHDRWIDKYTERRVSALADLKNELEETA